MPEAPAPGADGRGVTSEGAGSASPPDPVTTLERFRYEAIEPVTGRRRRGEMDGGSAYDVRQGLRRASLDPVSVERVPPGTASRWSAPIVAAWHARLRRQRASMKADLADALATLLEAGVTLDEALTTIAQADERRASERTLAGRIRDRLRQGVAVAVAMGQEPAWFDRFDLALLGAGQQAGDLIGSLRTLARHHQRLGQVGQKLFIALAYPTLLAIAGVGVVIFLSQGVLPQLTNLILQAHRQPPGLTLVVMGLGQILARWWPVLIALGAGAAAGWTRLAASTPPDRRIGRILHQNPLARARRRYAVAHVSWSLAQLRRAGLPLTDGLQVVGESLGDRALRRTLLQAVQRLQHGVDLSTTLRESRLVDAEVAQLLHLGERSGELTAMLEQVAERAFRAADRTTDRLAALLGPAAIIVLAGLIGTVVLACALPLAHLGDLI